MKVIYVVNLGSLCIHEIEIEKETDQFFFYNEKGEEHRFKKNTDTRKTFHTVIEAKNFVLKKLYSRYEMYKKQMEKTVKKYHETSEMFMNLKQKDYLITKKDRTSIFML